MPILLKMEKNGKNINLILENFLKGEARASDLRIITIRKFLSVLQDAVARYSTQTKAINTEDRNKLIAMIEAMAEIYREEISQLLVKRGKLSQYIKIIRDPEQKETELQIAESVDSIYIN